MVQLEAVLADAARVGVDRFVCLGDVNDLGPQPNQLIARLVELEIPCLKGNHDLLHGPALSPPHVNAWCRAQLTAESRAYLEQLPDHYELRLPSGEALLCVHGSPRNNDEGIYADTPEAQVDAAMAQWSFDLLASGHTHVQLLRRHRGKTLINAGSVSQPFLEQPPEGQPPVVLRHAEYAVLDAKLGGWSIDFRKVPYDFDAYARDVRASGLPDPDAWLATWLKP
jgi:predicted phosphodiesterase